MNLAVKEDKYLIKYLAFISHFEAVRNCERCRLKFQGQHKCPGLGNLFDANVMFIGEAPGKVENPELRGLPFVGNRSSDLLLEIIYELWPNGYDDVYITNIVKCNPPDNRTPTEKEIMFCHKWLEEEIKLIDPKIIVALGRTAANWFGIKEGLNKAKYRVYSWGDKKLYILYHPAYILRCGPKMIKQYKAQFKRIRKAELE